MIYHNLGELIPGLVLDIYEYYTECYNIQDRILGDPISVLTSGTLSILGFESNTIEDINLSSFKNDEPSSKELYKKLKNSKFYFTLWINKLEPEELHANQIIFTTPEELKGYMKKFLQEKGNRL